MKPLCFVLIVSLAVFASSASSDDPPAPATPVGQAEQIKPLLVKIGQLEKRIADLEKVNDEALQALRRQSLISALERSAKIRPQLQESLKQLQKQEQFEELKKRPKFHLLNFTEIGVPFSVERAMMGDAQRFQQFAPQERYEFNVAPLFVPTPEVRPIPER